MSELLVRHGRELGAGDDPGAMVQADLAGDRQGGAGVVAGDHDGAHTGTRALRHGVSHPGPDGVLQGGEAEVLELEVVLLGGQAPRLVEGSAGHPEDAAAAGRGRLHLHGERSEVTRSEVAEVCDRLGRPLGGDHVPVTLR